MSSDRIKKICIAVCFGFVVLSRSRPCVADDLEASLKQAYQGKVFVVRSFFRGNKLEYNENGNLSGHADTGLWTLDGLARLENIGLQGDTLRLKCKRLAIIASDADLDYIDQVKDAKLEIDVAFGSNHLDKKSTDVAFSKIFIEDQTAFLGSLPNYWKPCITAAINGADEKSRPVCHFSSRLKEAIGEKQSQNPDTTAMLVPDTTPETPANEIFPVGYGVSKPRVLYGPNPPYTETAKIANLEGTCILALVVDSSGLPGNIEIQKPLGYGLDEQAIATVETWRFRPGVKEGRPVAVRIMVQLSFQH